MWLGSPFWPTNKGRKEERKPHVRQSFKLSSCVLDVFVNFYIGQIVFFFFFFYLEFQDFLAGQVLQHLPYFLEIQQTHILLAQDIQLAPVSLKVLLDLGNHGLPLHQ